MKWRNNYLGYILFFIIGTFASYVVLKFHLFELNYEISVPEFLISIATVIVGIYIAHTIQRNINKGQHQYAYIELKLDTLWNSFNTFSQKFVYDDKIEVQEYAKFNKEILYPVDFLRNIFISFNISPDSINLLEEKLNSFDRMISSLNTDENIIDFSENKNGIENKIAEINHQFSIILSYIQDI